MLLISMTDFNLYDVILFDPKMHNINYFLFIYWARMEPISLLLQPFVGLLYQFWMIYMMMMMIVELSVE
jgi:hypothetical protein